MRKNLYALIDSAKSDFTLSELSSALSLKLQSKQMPCFYNKIFVSWHKLMWYHGIHVLNYLYTVYEL